MLPKFYPGLDHSTEKTLAVRARLRTVEQVDAFDIAEQLSEERQLGEDGRREIERGSSPLARLKALLCGEEILDEEYDRLGIGPVGTDHGARTHIEESMKLTLTIDIPDDESAHREDARDPGGPTARAGPASRAEVGGLMPIRHLYELCSVCDGAGAIDPARIAGGPSPTAGCRRQDRVPVLRGHEVCADRPDRRPGGAHRRGEQSTQGRHRIDHCAVRPAPVRRTA